LYGLNASPSVQFLPEGKLRAEYSTVNSSGTVFAVLAMLCLGKEFAKGWQNLARC